MKRVTALLALAASLTGCTQAAPANAAAPAVESAATAASAYFDNAGRDDALAGGVKMIPITTAKGTFKVWTKRVGNNPTMKVLLQIGRASCRERVSTDV